MNCLESQELLQRRLDGRSVFDQVALEQHLTGCTECRAFHGAAQSLKDGLRLMPPVSPPNRLTDRIVIKVLAQHDALRRFRWRLLAFSALAASLFVAFIAGSVWNSIRDSNTSAKLSMNQVFSAEDAATPSPLPLSPAAGERGRGEGTLGASVAEAGEAVVSLTQGVSTGLEPVTDSAHRALDMFLREIPPLEAQEQPGLQP